MTGHALGARVPTSMFALEPPPYLLRLRDWLRDTDERYRVKPGLLRTFGWKVETVLAKDWREDSSEVISRLEAALDPNGLVSDRLVSDG